MKTQWPFNEQCINLRVDKYCTVESLEFVVAQISWYSWVALTHEF